MHVEYNGGIMPLQLSTKVVSALCGATVRQVDYWARSGLLKPSIRDAAGRGTRRRYSFRDLVALKTISKLCEGKCRIQQIRSAIAYLAAHYPDESHANALARLTLLTDGKTVYMLSDEHDVMEVITQQRVWAVPLGKLILDSESEIRTLQMEWSEELEVGSHKYQLQISRGAGATEFTAECRALPGLLETGSSSDEVVANTRKSIEAILEHRRRKGRAVGTQRLRGTA